MGPKDGGVGEVGEHDLGGGRAVLPALVVIGGVDTVARTEDDPGPGDEPVVLGVTGTGHQPRLAGVLERGTGLGDQEHPVMGELGGDGEGVVFVIPISG